MSENRACPQCGAELRGDALEGLCPDCLGKVAASPVSSSASSVSGSEFRVSGSAAEGDGQRPVQSSRFKVQGSRFGDYELLEEIAHGGMGVVYKARQVSLNRVVAVKMIRADRLAREEDIRRFRTEAQAAAQLQHLNIVAIHEVGEIAGQHFYSMDYVAGQSLSQVAREKPFSPKQAALYVQKIAEAIHYAHQRGILHRDLKPSNVLIDENDEPRVADFGLAKLMAGDSEMTMSGTVMGSPSYMPPEQASGRSREVTVRSDVYSLGAILYDVLCGRPPFRAETTMETLRQVMDMEPVLPRVLNPRAPRDLETIVLKCLQKEPTKRYASAQELADELGHFLRGEPIQARPIGPTAKLWRWCKRKPMAATALGLVIVVAVGSPIAALRIYNALKQARMEEGKAWLERAQSYLEEKNPFYAKLMASRAIGFRGFGREKLTETQRKKFLELLPPGSTEAREAELMLRGIDDYAPIWRAVVTNQDRGVLGVDFSPDGRLFASVSGLTNITVYDTATGTRKAILRGHSAAIECLAFSPDARLLASASDDQTIRLWDVVAHTNIATLTGYSRGMQMVAFSPDNRRLAGCGDVERTIRIWELPGGRLESELVKSLTEGYASLAFSPDGTTLAAGGYDGTVELWDMAPLQLKTKWQGRSSKQVWDLAFSPNGRLLAIASEDTTVKLWKMPSGEPIKELQGHLSDVHNVKFSPDGKTLASREHNGPIRLWAMPHGAFKAAVRPSMPLRASHFDMSFSPDGSLMASAGIVEVWELTSGHVETELTVHSLPVRAVAISPDGTLFASGSDDRTVALWDSASGSLKHELLKHPLGVGAIAFSPDNQWLASGCQDGIVRLWEVASGRLETELRGHGSYILALAFSPDGTLLASISHNDDVVRLWDVAQQKAREPIKVGTDGGNLLNLTFHPRGRWLALAGEDSAGLNPCWVKVWDMATGQLRAPSIRDKGRYFTVRFSRDGELLAAWRDRDLLHLWEATSGRLKAQWPGHSDWVRSLDFSPDNRLLASASLDHTIALWDVPNARLLGRLRGHSAGVHNALFTPDRRWLVSSSDDTSIRIWNVAAALNRPLDYAAYMNWFDLTGRTVTSKALIPTALRSASDMSMKSFTGKGLVPILQSGLSEEELDRTLFRRFLRAGNLSSAKLLLERHEKSRMAGWKSESETLGRAYLREAKTVLDYEGYRLAAQHAARARTLLPEKAAQAWHVTALAERGLKRWPESFAAVEKAIALEADNAGFWHDKAMILEQQDQKTAAREALLRAIELARTADEKDTRLENWSQHLQQLAR